MELTGFLAAKQARMMPSCVDVVDAHMAACTSGSFRASSFLSGGSTAHPCSCSACAATKASALAVSASTTYRMRASG